METSVLQSLEHASIQEFMRTANDLMRNKIYFNRKTIRNMGIKDLCQDKAREYLGKDINFLQDESGVSLYIRDVFGREYLRYFENHLCEFVFDLNHALLFYYALKANNHPDLDIATGLLYFLAGEQLEEEFELLIKNAPKSMITPIFALNPQLFAWRRCNHVLRKYMLPLSVQEGYKGYFFEKPNNDLIMYLVHMGMSYVDADKTVKNAEGGFFYSFLPVEVENAILPSVLEGNFNPANMDGYYAQTYMSQVEQIKKEFTLSYSHNVYTLFIKPRLVEHMGKVLTLISEELQQNDYLSTGLVSVYHLSQQRVGFMLRESLSLEDVFPTLNKYFKPAEDFVLDSFLEGKLL